MSLRINIPPLTRILLILLLGLSLAYQSIRWRLHTSRVPLPYLTIVPQLSIYYPWVFLTSPLAEQNLVSLLIAGATVLYGGKYLERAWGSREFGKFWLVATLIPNIIAVIIYLIWFAIKQRHYNVLTVIQGSVALQAAFLVAFKQLVPEHTVTILKGIVQIRVKHFPGIFLLGNTLSGVIIGTDTAMVLSWLGFLTSWIYLRFYKRQPDLSGASTGGHGPRGDASETFAFAYFWPDLLQPGVATIADNVYNAFMALGICTPFSAEAIESSNEQAMARGEGGLPSLLNQGGRRGGGGKREEAERRRALALKALDQRLQAATANRQQPAVSSSPGTSARGEASLQSDVEGTVREADQV
ncbi:Protein of unknown function DUF1751, integral membrane, eukaryotic [Lasallia pustulata]|uniref:Rhomboid family protein n=1 Tax=Lasallia pustulata TaxID=136370 RepID=A0A1W5CRB8_9LECA|nr:Protein of unknown function DUF1751, integral membrane, eukaryotic [Lasallia pustulata]